MQIDRQQFLIFVTAIASGGSALGCSARPSDPPVTPPVVVTADPEGDGSDVVALPAPDATPREEGPEPLGPAEEGLPMTAFSPSSNGGCRASKAPPFRGARCSDSLGVPGDCAAVRLSGGCASFPFVCSQCESYKRNFKPRVAEQAVACMLALTPQQANDACNTYRCGDEALLGACPDGSAQNLCASIAPACGTSVNECTALLSGMNQDGRNAVQACVDRGCSFGLWSCVESM